MYAFFRSVVLGLAITGTCWLSATLVEAQTRPVPESSVPASSLPTEVGQVDPTEPIDIVVTNSLSGVMGIGFSGGPNVELDPGEEVTVSFATVPINLFVYPLQPEVSTHQNTSIDENTIYVDVVEIDDVAPGDASINVDRGGSVYIF